MGKCSYSSGILNRRTRWGWPVSITLGHSTPWQSTRHTLGRGLGELHSHTGRCAKEKTLPLPVFEARFLVSQPSRCMEWIHNASVWYYNSLLFYLLYSFPSNENWKSGLEKVLWIFFVLVAYETCKIYRARDGAIWLQKMRVLKSSVELRWNR
jgi:hypothetical protein